MKLRKCIAMCSIVCLLAGSLSGCGSKEPVNDQTEDKSQQKAEHSGPKTITADYGEAFQSISGCAVIFNESENTYTFYNEEQCKVPVSPYSTFKVISTLMGLHNQVITSKDTKMGYSGTSYPIQAWNADLNLQDAFKNSCVWYFKKIIEQVGPQEVQKELTALNYGNCDTSEWDGSGTNSFPELNGFWLDSSLKISPIGQVEVLQDIIEGRTIYTQEQVDVLKSIMLVESNETKKVYGKTGTGTNGDAWFIGFEENQGLNIYFAIYLNDNASDTVSGTKAKEIALSILNE